jgi:hypothetical protein
MWTTHSDASHETPRFRCDGGRHTGTASEVSAAGLSVPTSRPHCPLHSFDHGGLVCVRSPSYAPRTAGWRSDDDPISTSWRRSDEDEYRRPSRSSASLARIEGLVRHQPPLSRSSTNRSDTGRNPSERQHHRRELLSSPCYPVEIESTLDDVRFREQPRIAAGSETGALRDPVRDELSVKVSNRSHPQSTTPRRSGIAVGAVLEHAVGRVGLKRAAESINSTHRG